MPLEDAVQAANDPFSRHGKVSQDAQAVVADIIQHVQQPECLTIPDGYPPRCPQASVPLTACRATTFLARSRHWVGQIIFFNVSLQQFCLQVQRSLGLFPPPVHVSKRLHLANHRCSHSAIPRPPLVKTGVGHPVGRGTVPIQARRLWLGAGSQEFGSRYILPSSSRSSHAVLPKNSTSTVP